MAQKLGLQRRAAPSYLVPTIPVDNNEIHICDRFGEVSRFPTVLRSAERKYHGIEAAMPLRRLGSDVPTSNENLSPALPNIKFVFRKLPLPR